MVNISNYGDYPDLSNVRKVLVIVFKNIGDVVLTSPVYTVLKRSLPGATVDALVNSGTEEVLMDNPYINHIHVLNREVLKKGLFSQVKEEFRLLRSIRSSKYDLSVVLSTGGRGKYLGYLSGARIRVGLDSKKMSQFLQKRLLTIPVRQAPANRHYIERNLDCLRRIGIFPDINLKSTIFFEGDKARYRIKKLLAKAKVGDDDAYIIFHPTSRWMFKCWPYEKVAELIDLIQGEFHIPVVLTSGPDSSEMSYIKNVLSSVKSEVVNFSGILSLRELGALIHGARLFIGIDSAPMHISSAVKTFIIALFGPTSELDWGPWGEGHRVITLSSYSCRPCNRDGCGGSKVSECLTELEVSKVFNVIKEQLKKNY
jgi:heptosyltransferase-3